MLDKLKELDENTWYDIERELSEHEIWIGDLENEIKKFKELDDYYVIFDTIQGIIQRKIVESCSEERICEIYYTKYKCFAIISEYTDNGFRDIASGAGYNLAESILDAYLRTLV